MIGSIFKDVTLSGFLAIRSHSSFQSWKQYHWASAWDFQQCGMCDQQSLRSACTYPQSDQSLCKSLAYSMTVKLLTEYHLEFLSLKGGCTCSSESTLVKMPHCWKSHAAPRLDFQRVWWFLPFCWCFTPQSTVFQSCWDDLVSSWVEPVLSRR